MSESAVQGTVDPGFEPVREALAANLAVDEELGASIVVTRDGRDVVDLWGGWADQERSRRWERDTLTNVWSNTKTVVTLAALMLVDRGLLDLDAPVARYWPEFAAAGKEAVTTRQVLSHTSGVPAWAQPFEATDLYDWDKATAALAAQEPWWEPGTASGYHLLNFGHLVGEVVRRITGQRLKEFVAREIAGPLGADFTLGVPRQERGRVSDVVPPAAFDMDLSDVAPDSPMIRSLTGPMIHATMTWSDEWRDADIGGANGHGNARSLARIQSVVSHGGELDGVRLLSAQTLEVIFEEQARGRDLVLGIPLRFGVGYALPLPETVPSIPEGRICFWGGWGGSMVVNDLDRRTTIAYVMNRMAPGIIGSTRSDRYIRAVYDCLA